MATAREEEVIVDLMDCKSQLERTLCDLDDEREVLLNKLRAVKDKKEILWKQKATEFQRSYQLKIELTELDHEVQADDEYVKQSEERSEKLDKDIFDRMRLIDYNEGVLNAISCFQGAINFYNEDSLMMEAQRKHKNLSDRRVELTTIESEISDLKDKIQREEEERLRAEEAERERQRLEEEKRKQMEEEKARLELEKQREMFRQQQHRIQSPDVLRSKIEPPKAQPFLTGPPIGPATAAPVSNVSMPTLSEANSHSSFGLGAPKNEQAPPESVPAVFTLSQFTW